MLATPVIRPQIATVFKPAPCHPLNRVSGARPGHFGTCQIAAQAAALLDRQAPLARCIQSTQAGGNPALRDRTPSLRAQGPGRHRD